MPGTAAPTADTTPPGAPGAKAGKPTASQWIQKHKVEAGAIGVGVVAALALVLRKKSTSTASTSSTASGQPAGTTATTALPTVYPTSGGSGGGGGDWGSEISTLQTEVAAIEAQMGNPATGIATGTPVTGSSPATSGPSSPGYGTESINGQQYDVIGYMTGNGQFTGDNVSGGAPTYFDAPSGSDAGNLRTNLSAAQLAAEPPGTTVLVPAAFASQIGTTQVSGEQLQ